MKRPVAPGPHIPAAALQQRPLSGARLMEKLDMVVLTALQAMASQPMAAALALASLHIQVKGRIMVTVEAMRAAPTGTRTI